MAEGHYNLLTYIVSAIKNANRMFGSFVVYIKTLVPSWYLS